MEFFKRQETWGPKDSRVIVIFIGLEFHSSQKFWGRFFSRLRFFLNFIPLLRGFHLGPKWNLMGLFKATGHLYSKFGVKKWPALWNSFESWPFKFISGSYLHWPWIFSSFPGRKKGPRLKGVGSTRWGWFPFQPEWVWKPQNLGFSLNICGWLFLGRKLWNLVSIKSHHLREFCFAFSKHQQEANPVNPSHENRKISTQWHQKTPVIKGE